MWKSKEKKLDSFVLYRYMAKEYCEKMVNDGEIRISNSLYYKDGAGMTAGQRDDEHRTSVIVHASGVEVADNDLMNPRVDSEIVKLNTNDDQYKIDTTLNVPYWVLCLSVDLRMNLFDEFNGDGAVIIHHPDIFIERLCENSACLVPSPQYQMKLFYQPMQYLGELIAYGGPSELVISPCFTKPANYKHQKEFRIVWNPCYSEDLHACLQLGSLKDIAEVVSRDDLENGIVGERIIDEASFDKAAERGYQIETTFDPVLTWFIEFQSITPPTSLHLTPYIEIATDNQSGLEAKITR